MTDETSDTCEDDFHTDRMGCWFVIRIGLGYGVWSLRLDLNRSNCFRDWNCR